ncbi:MAG: hypothetical protein ACJ75B_09040 [Flavisolibacter sp.]
MKSLSLCIIIILFSFIANSQERLEFTSGGNHGNTLLAGHDYYVHADHNTFVGLSGNCKNLTVELDGQSGINLRGLKISDDLIIESINGASHLIEEDTAKNYPKNTMITCRGIIVKHFDNPNSYIDLRHYIFRGAYLGHLGEPINGDVRKLLKLEPGFNPCLNCSSINGGGSIDLVVSGAAVGTILGQTRVTLLKTKKKFTPNLSQLAHPDCPGCIQNL